MRTWLDFYVQGAADKSRALGMNWRDDKEAMYQMAVVGAARFGHALDTPAVDDSAVHQLLCASIIPFVAPVDVIGRPPPGIDTALFSGRGIQISRPLLDDLRQAKPPRTDLHWELLRAHTWYIDLPHHGLLVGREQQVRALFMQCPTGRATHCVAVLTRPASDAMTGRYAFLMDDTGEAAGGDIEGVDSAYFRESLADLVALVLLYRATANWSLIEILPRITVEDLARRKPHKRRALLARSTLFHIEYLESPPDRFGRSVKNRGNGGWQLEYRQQVRGYFKMQPYGPQAQLRRLIWIDAYERGSESETRVPVSVLRKQGIEA